MTVVKEFYAIKIGDLYLQSAPSRKEFYNLTRRLDAVSLLLPDESAAHAIANDLKHAKVFKITVTEVEVVQELKNTEVKDATDAIAKG